ncbi:unnamed protein product [Arctogadus glacialis]
MSAHELSSKARRVKSWSVFRRLWEADAHSQRGSGANSNRCPRASSGSGSPREGRRSLPAAFYPGSGCQGDSVSEGPLDSTGGRCITASDGPGYPPHPPQMLDQPLAPRSCDQEGRTGEVETSGTSDIDSGDQKPGDVTSNGRSGEQKQQKKPLFRSSAVSREKGRSTLPTKPNPRSGDEETPGRCQIPLRNKARLIFSNAPERGIPSSGQMETM